MSGLVAALCLLVVGGLGVAAAVVEVRNKRRKLASWLRVMGRVEQEEESETTSGHSSYRYRISFEDPSGRTGEFWESAGGSRLSVGSRVEVLVDPENLAAERVSSSNAAGGFVIILFFAGLALVSGLRMLWGAL